MKKLMNRFRCYVRGSYTNRYLFRFGAVQNGLQAAKQMSPYPSPIPADLTAYMDTFGKGQYASITKRAEIAANPVAKKGVKALQQILKDSGIFREAEVALKDQNSLFRKELEKIGLTASADSNGVDIGRSLFKHSLDYFDSQNGLNATMEGDFDHPTRLGVSFLQWKYGAKVDGAFGYDCKGLIKSNNIQKKIDTARNSEMRNSLKKLQQAVKKGYGGGEETQAVDDDTPRHDTEQLTRTGTVYGVGDKIIQTKYPAGQNIYNTGGAKIGEWKGNVPAKVLAIDAGPGGKITIEFKDSNGNTIRGRIWKRRKTDNGGREVIAELYTSAERVQVAPTSLNYRVGDTIIQDMGQTLYSENGDRRGTWPRGKEAKVLEIIPGDDGKVKIQFSDGRVSVVGYVKKLGEGANGTQVVARKVNGSAPILNDNVPN